MMMENSILTNPATMVKTTKIKHSVYHQSYPLKDTQRENLYRTLCNDGCEDFYNYIDWLDLAKGSNVIVLPASSSFFYIPEDLKNTETLINLKPLNLIKELKSFLARINSFLPEYSYLTGCFEDYNNIAGQTDIKRDSHEGKTGGHENGKQTSSWISGIIKSLFDRGTRPYLTKKSTTSLLAGAGFTVLDITVLNGKTYFCAQKRPSAKN